MSNRQDRQEKRDELDQYGQHGQLDTLTLWLKEHLMSLTVAKPEYLVFD